MNEIFQLIFTNLEKVGIGACMFLCAYITNILLGIWTNVKIEGYSFDWNLIKQSIIKFIIVTIGIILLTCMVTIIPICAGYLGIIIEESTLNEFSTVVIIGPFMTAAINYGKDALAKFKAIF